MKIGISSTGEELSSMVDQRFGRCKYFMVVNPENMDFKVVSNENALVSGGAGIQAAETMAREKVDIVISGNIGPNAFKTLNAAGIQVFTGAEGTVKDVVDKYKKGLLNKTDNPNVDSHHGMR